ncbi:maltose phosphorylase [Ligilactobacillus pabuli]|uniref:Maltose phosphorylase n=1 Tax=Ligilactobacillus pabuli TaxID=2886039 RepID=A0ABQ5JID6_9LACO|nr:glycoside hydrolase family 65 protein [Ligilactobacillus pabuli]GKS81799.1 maltose phosphorylase [Ligilactobacillus pabuli]
MERIFEIDPWKLVTHSLDPGNKRLQESLTSIGNEYMGMRGMFEEKYSGDTHHGIYIGGVWYPDKTRVGWWKNGYPEYFGKVINAVDFVSVDLQINGHSVDLAKDEFSDFTLELDMQRGLLTRSFVVKVGQAQVLIKSERFVSAAQKELYANRLQFKNLSDQAVELKVTSVIDANVINEDANYDEQFWNVLNKQAQPEELFLTAQTIPNDFGTPRFTVAMAAQHQTSLQAQAQKVTDQAVSGIWQEQLAAGAQAVFEKRVLVTTSRDYEQQAEIETAAHKLATAQAATSFDDLLAQHAAVWHQRWEKSDVVISGNAESQQGIRFNLFQLFSTYYGSDSRLNIGPKGFTGEKYGGATYWDTEAFAVPFYLGAAPAKVSRNLLQYRHNQLSGAYHNAQQQGLAGALFPMVTFNGIECHNEWEITFEEIHRNGTIAYAIYNYTRYTGDRSYVQNDGFDVLVGIARFWADRVHYSKRQGQYMIHGVTGPNEYENNVNNNWYTNTLAKWCLEYTAQIAQEVSAQKLADLELTSAELAHWQEIAQQMYLPFDEKLGIFVQHDTFLDKDLTPVADLPQDQLPLNQHWSWDHILRSPYIKQADVLQGIYYFIDRFTPEEKRRNFDFYEPLTVHESSLSAATHAVLAADLHKEEKAFEMYSRTARLDLDNYNNDTEDGLHITSMTGSWLAIVQGFAGMRVKDDQLQLAPFVPQEWTGYQFRLNFRGRLLEVVVDKNGTKLSLLQGEPLEVLVNDQLVEVK